MMKKKNMTKEKKIFNSILIVLSLCCFLIVGFRLAATIYDNVISVFKHDRGIDISSDMTDGIPRLYQWDSRWADKTYGLNTMEINGCGPTCLSMVCCGLTGETKWNPYEVAKMAEKNGYYVLGSGSSWKLMTEGAAKMGLDGREVVFDEQHILTELDDGHPIICAMGPGDFTTEGHFIVLTGITEDGQIIVNDPNSEELSKKTWELERLMGQMKNLWSYKLD